MKRAPGSAGVVEATVAVALAGAVLLPGLALGQEVVDLRTTELPRWQLEEEFRLGSVEGEHDAFVRPWLEVSPRGLLYVVDGGLPAVRVFAPDGTYLRQIGRRGAGPGEYTMPVNVGFRRDSVWVVDGTRRRVAFFSEDGRLLDDVGLDPERRGMEPPMPVDVLGLDDFLVVTPPGPDRYFRGYGVGRVTFRQSMVRRNRAGTRADTLVTYTVDAGYIVTKADMEGFSVVPSAPIPHLPAFSYNAERDEVTRIERASATDPDVGEFRVTVRRPDGTLVADRRFRYRPIPLAESVKDSIRDHLRSRVAQERVKVALEYVALPDFLPPVSGGATVGDDGTRWIPRESLPGATAARYLVTDSALNPLAAFELPPGAVRMTGPRSLDRVWAIVEDALGVRYLVRYRIDRD